MDPQAKKGLFLTQLLGKIDWDPTNQERTNYSSEQERIEAHFKDRDCEICRFFYKKARHDKVWKIEFKAESGDYVGKRIVGIQTLNMVSGLLVFPKDYSNSRPKFFLGHFQNNKSFQHLNIYNGGEMCIPLLTTQGIPSLEEIIEAIFKIFCDPSDFDPANFTYKALNYEDQQKIVTQQNELLEDWD